MTAVELVFPYGKAPDEAAMRGVAGLREVYGIRRVQLEKGVVRVEYDATRLNEKVLIGLLKRAGLDVRERATAATA